MGSSASTEKQCDDKNEETNRAEQEEEASSMTEEATMAEEATMTEEATTATAAVDRMDLKEEAKTTEEEAVEELTKNFEEKMKEEAEKAEASKEKEVAKKEDNTTEVLAKVFANFKDKAEKKEENKEEEVAKDNDDDDGMGDLLESSSTTSTDSDAVMGGTATTTALTSAEAEEKLVEASQLKEEGNVHFKEGDLDKAARAYRRGCSSLKAVQKSNPTDPQVTSLFLALHSNLSMVSFKQKKYAQTIQVTTKALKSCDPANVKLLYRRAAAYRQTGAFEDARADLRAALQHDATNSACKKELVLVKKQLEQSKASQKKALSKAFQKSSSSFLYNDKEEEEKKRKEQVKLEKVKEEELEKKRKLEWEDDCVKRMTNNEEAIGYEDWGKEQKAVETKKRKEEEKKRREERKLSAKAKVVDESENSDDELTAEEMAMMRGYKKTSDGRTTSYFSRELSEDEKKAQSGMAPKRLDTATQHDYCPSPRNSLSSGTEGASAWNAAGTWEEKDSTDWCKSQLRTRLQGTTVSTNTLEARIASLDELSGDASVALVSGKKRYIFDFHAQLKYEIFQGDDVVAKGGVGLPDICSTEHHELDVSFGPWTQRPSSAMEAEALESRNALATELRSAVQAWVLDFNNQY
jgi:tetratricopeptide (TPR) repeat protein